MQIVFIDKIPGLDEKPEHIAELKKLGELVIHEDTPKNDAEFIERGKDADIIVRYDYPVNANIFNNLPKLKYFITGSIGVDSIDTKTARVNNIPVSNVPGHNARAVAEHAIGLLLGATRKTKESIIDLQNGIWNMDKYRGHELLGKTLGILGYGNIGKEIEKIAKNGFEMKVLHHNTQNSEADLDHLLQISDFVISTLPLNDQTKNLLNDDKFTQMKPGAIFVNVGRGAVVDEQALLKHLENGHIAAAALDVLTNESSGTNNPLTKMPNVLVTPHTAWNSYEGEYNLSQLIMESIQAFVNGQPINIVN